MCQPASFRRGLSLQPTLYWKNAAQQGMPFTINPRVVYRGLGAAMAAQIGEFGLQYALIGWVKHVIVGKDVHRPMTMAEDMGAAVLGGAMGAVYTSPVELAMVRVCACAHVAWPFVSACMY